MLISYLYPNPVLPRELIEMQFSNVLYFSILITCAYGIKINPLNLIPSRVRFYLYPQKSEGRVELELPGRKNASSTSPLKRHPWTVFLIHGHDSDPSVFEPTKDAYLHSPAFKSAVNVVLVDWSKFAEKPKVSFLPVPSIPKLAKQVAWRGLKEVVGVTVASRAIAGMIKGQGLRVSEVHLIGHGGGGCEVAAAVGKAVSNPVVAANGKKSTGKKIGRITGLDPDGHSLLHRLDPGLARYVDVMYFSRGAGLLGRGRGHANYYVNGGSGAPRGCKTLVGKTRDECVKLYPLAVFNDAFKRFYFGCPCGLKENVSSKKSKKNTSWFKKPDCNLPFEEGKKGNKKVKGCFWPVTMGPISNHWTRGTFYVKARSACDLFPAGWKGILKCSLI